MAWNLSEKNVLVGEKNGGHRNNDQKLSFINIDECSKAMDCSNGVLKDKQHIK